MDNLSTGLVTATRADVKTGLAVYLTELKQQNMLVTIDQFLFPVTSPILETFVDRYFGFQRFLNLKFGEMICIIWQNVSYIYSTFAKFKI